jgi:hypothetical protein
MAKGDQVIGVSDQDRGGSAGVGAERVEPAVANPGGVFHPVHGHVEQQRTDNSALRRALLGGGEPAVVDRTGAQPPSDMFPGGNPPSWASRCSVVDPVERGGQIASSDPHSGAVLPLPC